MASPIRVLLIAENPADARAVEHELCPDHSRTPIQLDWVHCLADGRTHLSANLMDAVLLDLSMPGRAGPDTLICLLQSAPHIPVIVLTGPTDEESGVQAVQAGAQDYLTKAQVEGGLLARVIQYAIQCKQTELQLADARRFTERILSSAPVGILTYKLTGECVSVNEYAAQIVGSPVGHLLQQNFYELQSWKTSGLLGLAQQTIATALPTTADIHLSSTFGRTSWCKAQFVTFCAAGEDLLLLTLADITERKFVESALEASEKRFRTWIENSSDIMTVLDAGARRILSATSGHWRTCSSSEEPW